MKRNAKLLISHILLAVLVTIFPFMINASEIEINNTDNDIEVIVSDSKLIEIDELMDNIDDFSVDEISTLEKHYDLQEQSLQKDMEYNINTNSPIADLRLRNFVPLNYSQPFPLMQYIPFKVQVENIGSAPALGVELTIYVNNTSIGTSVIGHLEPGQGAYVEVSIRATRGGTHNVTLVVNQRRSIRESNYSNNSVSNIFSWTAYNGVCAFSFEPSDGLYDFMPNNPKSFDFAVGNFGESTVNDVQVAYVVNNSITHLFTLNGSIPPGYVRTGSISIGFGSQGTREIGILVDPYEMIADYDRSDNLLLITVHVTLKSENSLNNRDEQTILMGSTDHGWTAFNLTLDYTENYYRTGSTATYPHRKAYVLAVSSRPSYDTPYTISVEGAVHTSSEGKTLQSFAWTTYTAILPTNHFYAFHKENSAIVNYPANNSNTAGFNVIITGSSALYPHNSVHRMPLTIN